MNGNVGLIFDVNDFVGWEFVLVINFIDIVIVVVNYSKLVSGEGLWIEWGMVVWIV